MLERTYKMWICVVYVLTIFSLIIFSKFVFFEGKENEMNFTGVLIAVVLLNICRLLMTKNTNLETVYHLAFQTVAFIFMESGGYMVIRVAVVLFSFKKGIFYRRLLTIFCILLVAFSAFQTSKEENISEIDAFETEMIEHENIKEDIRDEISKFHELDEQRRLNLAQKICSYECKQLNLPVILVKTENLGGKGEVAYFQWGDAKNIVIDKQFLRDSQLSLRELIMVVTHETYHWNEYNEVQAYNEIRDSQYEALIMFEKAKQYKKEIENYISAEDNRELYENQLLEKDARLFSQRRMEFYEEINVLQKQE